MANSSEVTISVFDRTYRGIVSQTFQTGLKWTRKPMAYEYE